jgi:hypothetical protein
LVTSVIALFAFTFWACKFVQWRVCSLPLDWSEYRILNWLKIVWFALCQEKLVCLSLVLLSVTGLQTVYVLAEQAGLVTNNVTLLEKVRTRDVPDYENIYDRGFVRNWAEVITGRPAREWAGGPGRQGGSPPPRSVWSARFV